MALPFLSRSHEAGIPSVRLRRLLPDARFVGCRDLLVSGCSADSRRIEPGQVFVALRGATHDGHDFAARALERGAVAVVAEELRDDAGPLQILVSDSRAARARICQALAGCPSGEFPVVGVSGTAGKTAATLFLRAIYEADGRRVGSIGSGGWSDGARTYPSGLTEPDAPALAGMLSAMVERRCDAGVMAIGPRGLSRREGDGIDLAAAMVTSVRGARVSPGEPSQRARRAMARLVRQVQPGGIVAVNADDPDAALLAAVNLSARSITFGLTDGADVSAIVEGRDLGGTRLRLRLRGLDREPRIHLRPLGEAPLLAALGAAAVAREEGVHLDAIVAGLESVSRVPGQLDAIARGAGRVVIADRARDGRALRAALRSLRERTEGQVICVLTATSDASNVAEIVLAAEQEADRVVLTRDSGGSPGLDAETWLASFRRPGRVRVLLDRRKAVPAALDLSRPGDAVLLSGTTPRPWCPDVEVANEWMIAHEGLATRRSA